MRNGSELICESSIIVVPESGESRSMRMPTSWTRSWQKSTMSVAAARRRSDTTSLAVDCSGWMMWSMPKSPSVSTAPSPLNSSLRTRAMVTVSAGLLPTRSASIDAMMLTSSMSVTATIRSASWMRASRSVAAEVPEPSTASTSSVSRMCSTFFGSVSTTVTSWRWRDRSRATSYPTSPAPTTMARMNRPWAQ